jgi:PKD repeat protein
MRKFLYIVILTVFSFLSKEIIAQPLNANAGSNQNICAGGSVTLGATPSATGGTVNYTYNWSPAAGLSCTNCPNPICTATTTTTYTLTVDDGANVDDDQVTVNVNPSPTASFTFSPNNQCSSTPVVFTNTSIGVGLTYSWNFGNPASGSLNTSTLQNPTHLFVASGNGTQTFTVSLVIQNLFGCTATVTNTITVNQSPGALLVDPFTDFKNCDGSTFNLQVFDNTIPASNNSWTISWGDGSPNFTAGAGTFPGGGTTHTYSTVGIFSMTFTVTGTNGCVSTATQLVSNITNPAIGVANPGSTNGCAPITLCFPLSNAAGNHISTTYRVDYGDGSPFEYFPHPPPASICHTYTQSSCPNLAGAYVFSITARNACDSSTATVTPIRIFTGPEAHFTPFQNPVCTNSPVSFTNTSVLGYNAACSSNTVFVWNWGDGSPTTNVLNNLPQVHTYSAPGTYTVTLSAQNSCKTTIESHVICVENPPVPAFTLSASTGCFPLVSNIDNTSTTLNTCNVNYVWTVLFNGSPCLPSAGTFAFTNGTDENSFEPQITFNEVGNYTVKLIVSNSCGAIVATQPVVVNGPPQVTLNPIGSICASQSITPVANYIDCSSPITNYSWTFPGGTPANSSANIPGTITFSAGGTPLINITVTNACGTVNANQNITVNNSPPAPVANNNSPICEGEQLDLTASTIANASYTWSGPNTFSSASQNPFIASASSASAGIYTVFATVNGCTGASATTNVVVNPAPIVTITPSTTTICGGENVTLTANGGTTYSWSDGTSIVGTNAILNVSPSVTTTYTVTGTGAGCDGIASVTITVNNATAVSAGPDLSFCNQPIAEQLNGTPIGGTWSGPNITPSGAFTPSGVGVFTFTYTFTNVNGCTASDNANITVVNPVSANAGNNAQVCLNANALNLVGSPAGGTWSGSNVSSGGIFTPSSVGVFTLTYTLGVGSCQTSDNVDITVLDLPVVNAGSDFAVCVDNGIVSLSGTPVGGTWSGTGITGNNFNPLTAGTGSFTLTYSLTSVVNGCVNTDNLIADVNALPSVNVGLDTTICNLPAPINFSATPIGGAWSGPNITSGGVFTPSGVGTFTVTYTFTLGTGCTDSEDKIITVIDPVPADAGPDDEICFNAAPLNLVGLPAGGTWSGTNVTAGGVFTPSTSGTFNLTYIFGVGNCQTTDQMQMIVHALPTINAGIDLNACVDIIPFDLAGVPLGGTWSGTGITNVINGTFNPAIAGVGTHIITYTVTDPVTGCQNSSTRMINVRPLPVLNFTHPATVCVGAAAVMTNTTTIANQWSWTFGDGGTSLQQNPSHIYLSIGTYTITLMATTPFGCDDVMSSTIDVLEPPTSNFSLAPDSACGPLTVAFTDLSSGAGISYLWNFGNGNTSTNSNPGNEIYNAGFLADTTYYITLELTNFCGTVFHSDSVKVMPIPTAIFGTDFSIGCSPFSPIFANNSVGLPDSFSWDFGNGTFGNTSDSLFTHTFVTGLEDTTFTITLILQNECGADTTTQTITVLPNIVNAFFNTSITSGCAPLIVDFTQFSTGANFYSWDFGDGNVSTDQSPTHTFATDGIYTVSLMINDGCSFDTTSVQITVFPEPQIDFSTLPDSVCVNQNFNFTNLSTGVGGFNWDFGDGTFSTLTNPTHSYPVSGTYTVTLTGTSLVNGCLASISHDIVVRVNPVTAFAPSPLQGCEPLNVSFTNNTTGATFYAWNFGDGNTSIQVNPSHTYANAGNYTVMLAAQSTNGCTDTAYVVVTVFPKPVASFFPSDSSFCSAPHTVNMNNTSTNAVGFEWDFGNGQTSVLNNPSVTYTTTGSNTITLIATSLNGCLDTSIFVYTIYPTPEADFAVNPTGCAGQPVTFTSLDTNGVSYFWDFGDGETSTDENPNHIFVNAGIYDVTFTVTGLGGCTDVIIINNVIEIFPTPIADFTYQNIGDPNSGTIQFTNETTGGIIYKWDFGNGGSSVEVDPIERYDYFGFFGVLLSVTNAFGCTDTIYQTINVDYFGGLFVPNAIQPGSPFYEVSHFLPKGVGLKTYHITIWDAWGNLIWESEAIENTRPKEAWDGTFNGQPLPQDAYVWKVDATFLDEQIWQGMKYPNGFYRASGTVTIIK